MESVPSMIDCEQMTYQQIKVSRVIFVWRIQDFNQIFVNVLVVGVEISDVERWIVLLLIEVVAKNVKPDVVTGEDNTVGDASVVAVTFKLMKDVVFW